MEEPLTVHAYDGVTGKHVLRLPYTGAKWSDSLNDAGSLQVDVDYSSTAASADLRSRLPLWRTILALQDSKGIRHAGYLTNKTWDAGNRRLSLTCGGGMTIMTRRLVLDHRLNAGWRDGEFVSDEETPPDMMMLHMQGTYPDIIRGLVAETMRWAPLPIELPAYQGGSLYRNYYAWDMAYVYDRIQDITRLQHGPDVRMDPIMHDDGSMSFRLVSRSEIVDHTWRWNTKLPRVRVIVDSEDAAGADMTTQVYATGGKAEDKIVMARRYVSPPGGMLLQSVDTTHTTDSDLASLQSYAMADLSQNAWPDQPLKLQVGSETPVRVGDWVDLRVVDDYLGDQLLQLKITGVDGDASNDWLSLQCKER